jgi:hypothetical protein
MVMWGPRRRFGGRGGRSSEQIPVQYTPSRGRSRGREPNRSEHTLEAFERLVLIAAVQFRLLVRGRRFLALGRTLPLVVPVPMPPASLPVRMSHHRHARRRRPPQHASAAIRMAPPRCEAELE